MIDTYSEMIENLIESFIKVEATKMEAKEEDVKLLLQLKKGTLKALLYKEAKYVRTVEIKEILELINQ